MFHLRATLGCVSLTLSAASVGANTITTVDSGGVGQYTSVVYGSDGLPLIAYYDVANGDLKVAHCQDAACTTSTKQTLDSAGDVGKHASVAIGSDGLGVIGYLDATNGRIKVARCMDVPCSSATTATLTSAGPAGEGADIVVPADSRPVLAFRDTGNALRVARCTDVACSDATAVTVDATHGLHPAIGVGGDGLPLVAGSTGALVAVYHCGTPDCGSSSPVIDPAQDEEGALFIRESTDPVLARTPDGRGAVAYAERTLTALGQTSDVRYRTCVDAACASLSATGGMGVASAPFPGGLEAPVPGLAVRADGRPILSARQPASGGSLRVAACSTADCLSAAGANLDGPGAGLFSSIAVSPAGLGLVAYHADAGGGALKTLYLDTVPTADLAVSHEVGPNPVGAGQMVFYRAKVDNLGLEVAQSVVVTYSLPSGVEYQTSTGCSLIAPGTVRCPRPDVSPGVSSYGEPIQARVPVGVTGPLSSTATVSSSSVDPNPANNSSTVSIATQPSLRITSPQILEGQAGGRQGDFRVELVDDGSHPPSVTALFAIGGGTATSGVDYQPASGAITFTPAGGAQSVTVTVLGDTVPETSETFFLQLSPFGASPQQDAGALILDDDPYAPAQARLGHGVTIVAALDGTGPAGPEHRFVLDAPARASFEIVADAISGDLQPLTLQLVSPNGQASQAASPSTIGGSVRMRVNTSDDLQTNRVVRVRSGGCTTCGAEDTYRLRAYETTARIPRFNNAAGQATVLILQNPTDESGTANVDFLDASGQRVGFALVNLPARGVTAFDTTLAAPGQNGSILVAHPLPYGALAGKAVAIEPATGFSFDTPLVYRPR